MAMDQETWSAVLRRLANDIDVRTYADVIDPLEFQGVENGVIYLMAPTDLIAGQVENLLGSKIAAAWRAETGYRGDIRVIVEGRAIAEVPPPVTTRPAHAHDWTWREYLKQARQTFLRCLNAHAPVRPGLKSHERRQLRELFDAGIPLHKVQIGILRTFEQAIQNNKAVTSFGYCKPHIGAAVRERRY